jgi:cytochrome c oxidase cbb3-type subunit 3
MNPRIIFLSFALPLLVLSGCKREDRGFRVSPPSASAIQTVSLNPIHPGNSARDEPIKNEYEENAYAMSEGKRLYSQMNCVGCHSHGGGGMGVPLMDSDWIYGNRPEQIFSTIVEGRPNGMPSFRGKLPDYQVWQLAAYVRSMSGLADSDAAPSRDDHMHVGPPENSRKPEKPKETTLPK